MFFLWDVCLTSWAIAGLAPSSTRRPPNVVVRYRICPSCCRILPNPAREHRLTPPSYMRSQVKCFVEAIASDHAIRRRLRRPQALATACHHKSIFLTNPSTQDLACSDRWGVARNSLRNLAIAALHSGLRCSHVNSESRTTRSPASTDCSVRAYSIQYSISGETSSYVDGPRELSKLNIFAQIKAPRRP